MTDDPWGDLDVAVPNPHEPGTPEYAEHAAREHERAQFLARAEEPHGSFWAARGSLTRLHDFARARRVAPWAVLGAALARVVAAVDPGAQLPPIIGSYASLNLFVGLVGASGAGKDAATKVSRDAIDLGHHETFMTAPLGSGEGLSHMFMRETKDGPEQYNMAALVTVGEIDTMTALVKRQSSTVSSQLRQAAMGEQLGFFYVDASKRMIVPEHRYRMCLIAGIQPKRAGALLEEADGGTPQRFVWLPATDPYAPDVAPACPAPLLWQAPKWHETGRGDQISGMYRHPLEVCDSAVNTIDSAHLARTRGDGEALNGHALLTRLKVAAALSILEGGTSVSEEDWALSDIVMQVSDATREAVVKVLATEATDRNRRAAEAEAVRTVVVQERVDEAVTRRVCGVIRRALGRADGWVAHAELRKAVAGRDRPYFESSLAALILGGQVDEDKTSHHGQAGIRYRLTGGST